MSHINPTAEELEKVRNRISSLMRHASAQEQELQGILDLMDTMSTADATIMTGSSSSAKRRRARPPPASAEDYRGELERKVVAKREEIALLWAKINELQAQERQLEKQPK